MVACPLNTGKFVVDLDHPAILFPRDPLTMNSYGNNSYPNMIDYDYWDNNDEGEEEDDEIEESKPMKAMKIAR